MWEKKKIIKNNSSHEGHEGNISLNVVKNVIVYQMAALCNVSLENIMRT